MPRPNRVNKYDYTDELREYHSSSLWTMRNMMANQEWWTVGEIHRQLQRQGFNILSTSVSAHIRTLRKPPPEGGQYPLERQPRSHSPLLYEYRLGEWGTGELDEDVICERCAQLEEDNVRLRKKVNRLLDRLR